MQLQEETEKTSTTGDKQGATAKNTHIHAVRYTRARLGTPHVLPQKKKEDKGKPEEDNETMKPQGLRHQSCVSRTRPKNDGNADRRR